MTYGRHKNPDQPKSAQIGTRAIWIAAIMAAWTLIDFPFDLALFIEP
jgi:hypothetical protein